jgi:hypothetical protein
MILDQAFSIEWKTVRLDCAEELRSVRHTGTVIDAQTNLLCH